MRKTITLSSLLALTFTMLFSTGYSQILTEFSGVEEVNSAISDLKRRMEEIPSDETEIILERNHIAEIRALMHRMQRRLKRDDKSVNYTELKTKIIDEIKKMQKLNCGQVQESLNTFQNSFRRLFILFDQIEHPYYDYNEYRQLESYFDDVIYFYRDGNSINFEEEDCERIKSKFDNPEMISSVNNLIDKIESEEREKSIKSANLISRLAELEELVNQYNQKLSEELKTVSTKNSLADRLYIMILVIGFLSIAAIGTVRLFPANVMKEWVESGQVIQFVTVMILLSVIMALGLAGLLNENVLGTLLGGIGGYVLSQGVGRSAARNAIRQQETKEL